MPEFRTAVMTLVEASWHDPSGALQTVSARMEDKSPGGACIRTSTPIGVGSKLKIQWRFEQFCGTARYCRSEGREYLVGIQRDAANSPVLNPPVARPVCVSIPKDVPPAQDLAGGHTPVSTVTIESPPAQEQSPAETSVALQPVESVPLVRSVITAAVIPPHAVNREIESRDGSHSWLSQDLKALRREKIQVQRPAKGKLAGKERKSMRSKWLGMAPWRNEQGGNSASGDSGGNEKSNGRGEKENLMSDVTPFTKKAPAQGAREVPDFQVELSPMEDIYRAAGIMTPRKGYSINKVVEMLSGEHIRGLSKEMKRVALLMALDAAGVPIDEVLRDAKARQDTLDAYEAQQKEQVEAEWARREEENIQIQAELESVKAHYTARISRNLEGLAREKATFASWVTLKQQECQNMADAAELCSKSSASEPASASPASATMTKAAAAGPHSRSEGIH
jgi:hypothetical protein